MLSPRGCRQRMRWRGLSVGQPRIIVSSSYSPPDLALGSYKRRIKIAPRLQTAELKRGRKDPKYSWGEHDSLSEREWERWVERKGKDRGMEEARVSAREVKNNTHHRGEKHAHIRLRLWDSATERAPEQLKRPKKKPHNFLYHFL